MRLAAGSRGAGLGPECECLRGGALARSANNVWAVGWVGAQVAVQHFDGTSWSNVAVPTVAGASQSRLLGIDAASDSDIWAVGYAITDTYHTLTMHWNGSAWSMTKSPDQRFPGQTVINALNGVSAVSAADVLAVGGDIRNFGAQVSEAVLLHWNGTQWTLSTPPDESFATSNASRYGVAAVSSGDVWALGAIGELRWNGAQWVYVGAASQATVGVSAVSATNVWAVGNTQGSNGEGGPIPAVPFSTKWNGSAWSPAQILLFVDGSKGFGRTAARAIDARTAGDVWVGSASTGREPTLGTLRRHLLDTGLEPGRELRLCEQHHQQRAARCLGRERHRRLERGRVHDGRRRGASPDAPLRLRCNAAASGGNAVDPHEFRDVDRLLAGRRPARSPSRPPLRPGAPRRPCARAARSRPFPPP